MKKLLALATGLILLFGVATSANCDIHKIDAWTAELNGKLTEADGAEFRKLKDIHTLYINCSGGDAWGMMEISQIIRDYSGRPITTIAIKAWSGGAVVWASGDNRLVYEHSLIMFHRASFHDAFGNKLEAKTDVDKLRLKTADGS